MLSVVKRDSRENENEKFFFQKKIKDQDENRKTTSTSH